MGASSRYAIFDEIGSGGMAAVHFGRLAGSAGFGRTVAIKRLRSVLDDADAPLMFLDEARLASRIHHPNVVQTLDVFEEDSGVLIVMEYVHGESLSRLVRAVKAPIDPAIVCAIATNVLHGLHSAHDAVSERGEPLGIVHRDVSPQNILVGVDGVARLLDFGIAKAQQRLRTTRDGKVRGKLAYMPPEQLEGRVDRRTDVYAVGVVMWEALTGKRLFAGDNDSETISKLLHAPIDAPNAGDALDAIVLKALARDPSKRYATAREMAADIEAAIAIAPPGRVGAWVEANAAEALARRSTLLRDIESGTVRATSTTDDARPSREPTVAEPSPRKPPRKKRSFAFIGVAALGVALAVLAVALTSRHDEVHAAPTPPTSTTTRQTIEPAPSIVTAAVATEAVVVTPKVEARAQPRPRAVASTSAVPVTTRPGCDPPYRIDSTGAKIWLPDCL